MHSIIRRVAAGGCAVALALAAAACGGDSSEGVTTVTVPPTTTAAADTGGATTVEAPTASLEELLPTSSEFVLFAPREPEVVGLDDFVDAVGDGDQAEADRAALTAAGFTQGIVQEYATDEQAAFAQAFVAEVSPDGAGALLDHVVGQLTESVSEPGIEVTPVSVDEAGARGVDATGTSGGQPVSGTALAFVDGGRLYGVQVAHQSDESLLEALRATVVAWQARVAGAGGRETPYPDAGEIALLALIPPATADACGRTTDAARAAEALASVRCDTENHRVYYERFATTTDMEESYDGYLAAQGIQRGEGTTCDEGAPAEGTWDGPENRIVCFVDDAGAWVVWSSVDDRLVAVAIDPEGNLQRVFRWWGSADSGPVR